MFKKLLTISLATCLGLSCFLGNITKANALDNDIMNYVISGSGTEDDPYILAGDTEYKEMFDKMAKEAVQPTVMPLVDFSGTLTGAQYKNQNNGGIWRYSGGGPSTSSNGALTILTITYNNNLNTGRLSATLNNASWAQALVDALVSGYCGSALATKLTPIVGPTIATGLASIFSVSIFSFAASKTDKTIVDNALSQGSGVLEISYRTSYNGSWFYTDTIDYWRDYGTVKTPGSYYGNGVYHSY